MEDSWDPASNKGPSGLDMPHKLVFSVQWQLPSPPKGGLLHAIAGGWVLNSVFLYESGQALTLLAGVDQNGNFDSAGDRAWENPNGVPNTGSGVNAVCFNGTTTTIAGSCPD